MIQLIIKKLPDEQGFEARIKDTPTSAQGQSPAEAIGRLVEQYGDTVNIGYEFNPDPVTMLWREQS